MRLFCFLLLAAAAFACDSAAPITATSEALTADAAAGPGATSIDSYEVGCTTEVAAPDGTIAVYAVQSVPGRTALELSRAMLVTSTDSLGDAKGPDPDYRFAYQWNLVKDGSLATVCGTIPVGTTPAAAAKIRAKRYTFVVPK